LKTDITLLLEKYTDFSTQYTAYNGELEKYNTLKTTYNKELADETQRKEDIIRSILEPAIALPARPCPPT